MERANAVPEQDRSKWGPWRKSPFSGGNDGGDCVEVADTGDGGAAVRDGKLGDTSPVLVFTGPEWDAFLRGAAAGHFDHIPF